MENPTDRFDGIHCGAPDCPNALRDQRCGSLDGIASKVRVTRSRLHLRVAEELPNHRQALTKCQSTGGVPMAQVVSSAIQWFGTRER